VTRADCATTLKNATIGFTVLNPDEEVRKKVFAELNRRKGEIQQAVSRNVILKYTPVLRFVFDRNIEEGDRVLAKIRELEEQERNENP
jgi:ribosome-binding factor A